MTDLHGWITQQVERVEQLLAENEWPHSQADGVRRRCEADRRVLTRHTLDPDNWYEPACKGCRTYSDQDMAYTDDLNECPELLDLAHAHGITDEILASLDRPEKPTRPEPKPRGGTLPPGVGATADVPPALRGPNWSSR
jgi:hypothetical protein